jgi:hypothetical protein
VDDSTLWPASRRPARARSTERLAARPTWRARSAHGTSSCLSRLGVSTYRPVAVVRDSRLVVPGPMSARLWLRTKARGDTRDLRGTGKPSRAAVRAALKNSADDAVPETVLSAPCSGAPPAPWPLSAHAAPSARLQRRVRRGGVPEMPDRSKLHPDAAALPCSAHRRRRRALRKISGPRARCSDRERAIFRCAGS